MNVSANLLHKAFCGLITLTCQLIISYCIAANLTYEDFITAKADRDRAFRDMLDHVVPEIAEMLAEGQQVDRLFAGCTRMFVREAYGPGWALVGDAGMKKDPISAQGIAVAFEYAQKLADAIDEGLAGRCDLGLALRVYEQDRDDRLMPFYDFTVELEKLAKPTP